MFTFEVHVRFTISLVPESGREVNSELVESEKAATAAVPFNVKPTGG